jgi:hypothetical protein
MGKKNIDIELDDLEKSNFNKKTSEPASHSTKTHKQKIAFANFTPSEPINTSGGTRSRKTKDTKEEEKKKESYQKDRNEYRKNKLIEKKKLISLFELDEESAESNQNKNLLKFKSSSLKFTSLFPYDENHNYFTNNTYDELRSASNNLVHFSGNQSDEDDYFSD